MSILTNDVPNGGVRHLRTKRVALLDAWSTSEQLYDSEGTHTAPTETSKVVAAEVDEDVAEAVPLAGMLDVAEPESSVA